MKMCKTIFPFILLLSVVVVAKDTTEITSRAPTTATAETTVGETAAPSTATAETTVGETAAPSTATAETTVGETAAPSTATAETTVGETAAPSTATAETTVGETAAPSTATAETTVGETAAPSTATAETTVGETAAPSTATAETTVGETAALSTAAASTVVMDTPVVRIQVSDAPGLIVMTTVEVVTSKVATTAVSSPVAPGNIKATKFLPSSKTPEAHIKVEQNTVLGHENISALALTSVKTFSSSTVKTNRESTFFFKSTAKQLASENYKLTRLTIPTSEPEKKQKSSGLVIGLSIFFVILLSLFIVIAVCCIRKKSKKSTFDLHSVEATIPLHPLKQEN